MTFNKTIQAFINNTSALSLVVIAIGLSWQALFSQILQVDITWNQRLILGLTIWLIYTGDRLLDIEFPSNPIINQRHIQLKQFSPIIRKIFFPVLILDIAIAFYSLNRFQLTIGLILSLLCLTYTKWISRAKKNIIPKEIIVASLFSFGIFLFLINPYNIQTSIFWISIIFFNIMLTCNSILVAFWEVNLDLVEDKNSIAITYPSLYPWIIRFTNLAGITATVTLYYAFPHNSNVSLIFLIPSLGLFLINFFKQKMIPENAHFLADICFLSPCLFLIFQIK